MASLDELTEELKGYQGNTDDYPSQADINQLMETHGVTDTSQKQRDVLSDMTNKLSKQSEGNFGSLEGLMDGAENVTNFFVSGEKPREDSKNMEAPVDPTLAAQAEAATVSALSNPSLIAPGFHVQGNLNATVYDKVDLTFQSSYLKNNLGTTTYTHNANVTINAKHVRLTAPSLTIKTTNEERNTVTVSKVSKRILNIGGGLYSTQSTPISTTSLTAVNFEPSVISNSAALARLALVGMHHNRAKLRVGAKGLNLAFKESVSVDFASSKRNHRVGIRIIL